MLIYFLSCGIIWNLPKYTRHPALKWQKENHRERGRECWPGTNLKMPLLIWAVLSSPPCCNKWKLVSPTPCDRISPHERVSEEFLPFKGGCLPCTSLIQCQSIRLLKVSSLWIANFLCASSSRSADARVQSPVFSILLQKTEQASYDTAGAQITGYLIAVKAMKTRHVQHQEKKGAGCANTFTDRPEMTVCPNAILAILW